MLFNYWAYTIYLFNIGMWFSIPEMRNDPQNTITPIIGTASNELNVSVFNPKYFRTLITNGCIK